MIHNRDCVFVNKKYEKEYKSTIVMLTKSTSSKTKRYALLESIKGDSYLKYCSII